VSYAAAISGRSPVPAKRSAGGMVVGSLLAGPTGGLLGQRPPMQAAMGQPSMGQPPMGQPPMGRAPHPQMMPMPMPVPVRGMPVPMHGMHQLPMPVASRPLPMPMPVPFPHGVPGVGGGPPPQAYGWAAAPMQGVAYGGDPWLNFRFDMEAVMRALE
jgi:hypothetical protein